MITGNQSSPRLSFSPISLLLVLLAATTLACGALLQPPTPQPTAITETVDILPDSGVAIVATNTTILRSEPDAASERLMDLQQGDVLTLLARTADGAWVQVIPDGATTRGWTGARFLTFVTPTPSATAGETATETATATAGSPDTPTFTPTATASIVPSVAAPDTPTFTPTVAPASTATPEPTPKPPDTPTFTPTLVPAVTETPTHPLQPTNTALPTTAPLTMGVDITWRLDPADNNEAIASVLISASGGNGAYTYYRDGIAQPGPSFEYRWRTCTANPVSFRVTSGAESVETSRYEIPPCPPDTPTPTSTIAVTAVPSP